jgi:TldD protein
VQDIYMKNARPDINYSETNGFGVRVIVNGAWGFSSSSRISPAQIRKTTLEAIQIARHASKFQDKKIKLAPEPAYVDFWATPYIEDPFSVDLDEKVGLLSEIDSILRKNKKVINATGNLHAWREHQWFASTEGSCVEQILTRVGAGYSAESSNGTIVQERSFPCSFGRQCVTAGYEYIRSAGLVENAERTRDEAVALLSAPVCPSGRRDIIIEGSQLALQIHESCGHPSELDRVLGHEANYAGRSFITPDKLGKLKYGSDIVNIVADSTLPMGLATFGYDDDGVRAQRYFVVEKGIYRNYLTNRELVGEINEKRSRGCNRAHGSSRIPMIRMINMSLLPGTWEYDELLDDSDGALLLEMNKSWSIDQMRVNFQFGCEAAWELKNGKKAKLYRDPTYQGKTVEFWNSCDAICNQKYWHPWGVVNCGKGQPSQTAEMTHGTAPARFRNVEVGIAR